jgi:poly-gamma-glutamate synthesis protein (capsule biosynthesis protein)
MASQPSQEAVLALAGDVMLGRGAGEQVLRKGPAYPWGDTRDALRSAGAAIINLECVIASGGEPWSRWPKEFHFRSSPLAIRRLQLAGIDCVTLANNHVFDYEVDAFFEMQPLLEAGGIAFTGAGRNLAEAARPALLDIDGLKIGVVAFTDNEEGWGATSDSCGTNWIPIVPEAVAVVRSAIRNAREHGAQFVVVSIHWGPNMALRPPDDFRHFARLCIAAGADLWFGHSAHLFQGIEIIDGHPVIYDAGDFVDDYAVDPKLRNDWGLLFRAHLVGSEVRELELIPTLIENCQVNFACGTTRQQIAARASQLCSEFATPIQERHGSLFIDCQGGSHDTAGSSYISQHQGG